MKCLGFFGFVLFLFLYCRGQQDTKSWGKKLTLGFAKKKHLTSTAAGKLKKVAEQQKSAMAIEAGDRCFKNN